ncbi:MAG: fatty acid desaturase, partial [Proteobacteria bacterium]|nr:fatty acid desaturase [Pseudomonadota bacterium]
MAREAALDREALRAFSRVSNLWGAADAVAVWGVVVLAWVGAAAFEAWWATLVAFVVVGSRQNALATLAHEAWHRLCFGSPTWNHRVGAWLYAYPLGIAYHHDRRRHLRHHREVGIATDPDWINYTSEGRETPLRVLRYLASLLCGVLFFETAWSLVFRREPRIGADTVAGGPATGDPPLWAEFLGVVAVQGVLFVGLWAAFAWWFYPLLWLAPLATVGGFLANFRALLEHVSVGPAAPSARLRDFDAGPIEAFLVSPSHFHYHALHHAYVSIPHRKLPEAKIWILARHGRYPHAVSPGYLRSFWRHLRALARSRRQETAVKVIPDREPEPRAVAVCDQCGGAEGRPVTGWLRDVESAAELPPSFRDLTFRFVRCGECGLVYMRERPSLGDLDVFYGDAYKCFESYADRGPIMLALARAVARGKRREIERLMPAGQNTLLDYGCGAGTWLDLMQGLGCSFRMIGTDVTEGPLEELRRRGVEAHCCDETTLFEHLKPGSVGVIHFFHVIEHLPSVR